MRDFVTGVFLGEASRHSERAIAFVEPREEALHVPASAYGAARWWTRAESFRRADRTSWPP